MHCLHTNTSLQNIIHVSKVHCGSAFEPGAPRLPYYFTPPVCVPAVMGGLAMWRHNNKQNQTSGGGVPFVGLQEEQRGPSGYTPRSLLHYHGGRRSDGFQVL